MRQVFYQIIPDIGIFYSLFDYVLLDDLANRVGIGIFLWLLIDYHHGVCWVWCWGTRGELARRRARIWLGEVRQQEAALVGVRPHLL